MNYDNPLRFYWCLRMNKVVVFLLVSLMSVPAIASEESNPYQQWKSDRVERLKAPYGWLSLVGFEWLSVGENSIGAAADNDIQLDHGPEHLGHLIMTSDHAMFFVPKIDSGLKINGEPATDETPVYADTHEQETTVFTVDTFQFYVVERGRMAFRIKDSQADTRLNFTAIDYFPEQPEMRIDANFIPYEPAKIIPTVNVMGVLSNEESPGRLEFEINGEAYSLDAFDSDGAYFMVFADKTNGQSTYGPGRFLYTDGKVNEQGKVRIDFNKAYNPPCAFTAYSTCTLPPLQNRMAVEITAGEKKYGDGKY